LQFVNIDIFLLCFLILLVAAKLGGELAERLGQPSVLGEILAGIALGASGLGWISRTESGGQDVYHLIGIHVKDATLEAYQHAATYGALNALAEVGVIILLFEIGLHSDLYELRKVGGSALWVGFAGVILPMVGGYAAMRYGFHIDHFPALFIGAALTATSVGITARVFQDMKMLHTAESQVVLGAAVADDVIGLVVLAVVVALAPPTDSAAATVMVNPWLEGIKVTLASVGFLVGALLVGVRCVPMLERTMEGIRSRGGITIIALVFCLGIALLGSVAKLAPIVGAFTAGLVLSHAKFKDDIQNAIRPIADIFIPLFFALTGSALDLRMLAHGWSLVALAGVLIIVAVLGKVLGCMTVPDKRLSKLVVGLGMIPRGEVGLIYARLGMEKKFLSGPAADGLILMVMATTLMTPPLLRAAMLSLKRERGEVVQPEMEALFPASQSGIDREEWEIFEVKELLGEED
jgi:Kef-type K+ transport system membrane component KefB